MANIKFKKILKEAAWDKQYGKSLPTLNDVQKAYEAKKHLNESEGYVEIMDMSMQSETGKNMNGNLEAFVKIWNIWKSGPATERSMHKTAKKDLIGYVTYYLNKQLK